MITLTLLSAFSHPGRESPLFGQGGGGEAGPCRMEAPASECAEDGGLVLRQAGVRVESPPFPSRQESPLSRMPRQLCVQPQAAAGSLPAPVPTAFLLFGQGPPERQLEPPLHRRSAGGDVRSADLPANFLPELSRLVPATAGRQACSSSPARLEEKRNTKATVALTAVSL